MTAIAQGPSLVPGRRRTDGRVALMPLHSCGVTDDTLLDPDDNGPRIPLRSADTRSAVAKTPGLCSQSRACRQLSQHSTETRWNAARKFLAVLS
jgi:hypothetical protein